MAEKGTPFAKMLKGKKGSVDKEIEDRKGKVVGKPKTMSDGMKGKDPKGAPKSETKKPKATGYMGKAKGIRI